MPTSYSVSVTVDGFAGANYGSQLDSLEIISGSTNPYELPQPPSARASFLGLPVVSGVTQTPDWWIGKKLTFTITPQGATGTVSFAAIVQGYNCSPVQTTSTDQIIELDLLGQTSRLSTEVWQGSASAVPSWAQFVTALNNQLSKTAWDEIPNGLTWDGATGTWNTFTSNKSNLTFALDSASAGFNIPNPQPLDFTNEDMLSVLNLTWGNKYKGWFWFDDTTITLNAPSSVTNYTQLTSLNATQAVLWSSLNTSQGFSNVINGASSWIQNLGYTSQIDYLDGASYDSYGYRYQDFGQSVDNAEDTKSMLKDKVNAYKQPNKYLQSLTINLDALTHVTGEWQNFYKSTKPVRLPITNIPAAYGGNHTYMVRGVQLNLTNKHAEATLLVVPETIYNPS